MASNSRQMLKSANPSTIQDKFMVGYQGWFTCPGDGEPVGPGHHGWLHWFNYPIPDGGRPNTDVWPDVSSYSPSELFPAPGLKTISGEQTFLFSSRNAKTVQRHFHWMAEHGVDGAFLQRFAGQCDLESGNQGIMRIRDEVGERVRESAEREGRVFAIMYDVSGVPADRIQRILERDWIHLVHELGVLDSPNYLREKGQPVIALWGFGFEHAGHTPALVRAITQFFRNNTPGGVYIMGGTPTHWRTGEGDADRNSEFIQVWLNEFDAISPWTIGRYSTEEEADNFAKTKMKGDLELITNRNQEGNARKVDYIPVVLPGGSGYNLSEGKWSFNGIKRQGGRFLWKQIFNAHRLGVRTIYGAMWDEYDEGTAFMPIVEHKRNLPVSDKYKFLSLDEDGYDVPSDWYMRICGLAAEGLRNERRIHETFPVKELQDYWSSRPRYEDVNPKSKEFRSGSLLSSNKSSDDVGGGEDPGGGGEGQTYQEWLALQREVKEEVPPPPYTLEGDESISTQTVTNPDIRPPIVATTAEVPLRNSPAVANTQPPVSLSHAAARPAVNTNTYPTSHAASSSHAVLSSSIPAASPPAININTYPTSASPASWQEAHSHVNAQPSYPPAQGHSPGSVHHHPQSVPPSQRHSPQPYPPGVSQHPQSHLPPSHSQHSPHAAPAVQSYPPHTGPQHHHQPYQAQTFQPYPPTSDQAPVWGQQPQPYPHSGDPSYQGYPTSTGHSQGYPSAGVPSQGYTSPVAQSYANSGSPVHHNQSQNSVAALGHDQPYPHSGDPSYQGYPTSIGHSQGYPSAGAPSQGYTSPVAQSYPNSGRSPVHHNQSQDSVAALGQEFGRQSISNPSGVSSGGRLPTPPPLHPSRPSRPIRLSSSSLKQTSSSGVSSGGKLPSPPPLHPAHPNYLTRPASSSLKPSSPNLPNQPQSQTGGHHHAAASPLVSSSSGQGTSTTNTATHRPRWPPAEWNSDIPPVRPPVQQFSGRRPSGHDHVGAALTRPQTVGASSSNLTGESTLRPTSSVRIRPSRPDTNMPPAAYGHSDDNANPFSFPEMYEQHVTFPPGPQYNTTYKTSGYPDQQGAMAYGSWPEPGRVSPPPTFPVSAMAYGVPGSSYSSGIESQYPGGPTFPSTTSAAGDVRMHFPEGPGGSYFDTSSSSLYRTPSTSGPPMQSQSEGHHHSSNGAKQTSSGAFGFALSAVDKMAGRRARDELESHVDQTAQSKLFNKFTK